MADAKRIEDASSTIMPAPPVRAGDAPRDLGGSATISTPDQRVRVFVSSTLQELADERAAAREAIAHLRLTPVLFELGARPHPPRALYRAYLDQSDIFIGLYWQRYGWVAPGEEISGLEDEYNLAGDRPKLIYLKTPAPEREPRLRLLLQRIRADDRVSYRSFSTAAELRDLIENDVAVLLTERFKVAQPVGGEHGRREGASLSPGGTVTLLFTDIEGSTRLWEQAPQAMQHVLATHDAILHRTIADHGGVVFKTVGDAFCGAFPTATGALGAAVAAQRALAPLNVANLGPLRVRMALHTGEPERRGGDFFGPPVNRVARLLGVANGGQILASTAVQASVGPALDDGIWLTDLGVHGLRDVPEPLHIWQVNAPGLPASFPPLKSLSYDPTNIPAPLTEFIGREDLLVTLRALLERPEGRLVTLTGPGGIGKTRLAQELAAHTRDDFPDGRYLVPLASVASGALLPQAIATALGLRSAGEQPLVDVLWTELRHKHMLLILDNFEHLIDAAPFITDTLGATFTLRILVTSREPLRLSGEHEVILPPLTLPASDATVAPEALLEREAVALFVARARAVRHDFTLTRENAAAVAAICRQLEGVPLAVELAAGRSRLFTPPQMLDRLSNRLAFLDHGSRDLPERQRSLRATIQWSYDLLAEEEKGFFRRLAVFADGFSLEAAQAIYPVTMLSEQTAMLGPAQLEADDASATAVLESVGSLLDKNLLWTRDGPGGEPRFGMLETIRAFALEALATSGEETSVRRLHAAWSLALAERAAAALVGPDQDAWLARLDAEQANMREALAWSLEADEGPEIPLRLTTALWRFWWSRGEAREGRTWLERALANPGESGPRVRTGALIAAAELAETLSDYRQATTWFDEALARSRAGGDETAVAAALNGQGLIQREQGALDRAMELHEEAFTILSRLGDSRGIAVTLNSLGAVAYARGDFAQAQSSWEAALSRVRALGDLRAASSLLSNLGALASKRGEIQRALALHEEALMLAQRIGDVDGGARALVNLAGTQYESGDYAQAGAAYEAALARFREIGDLLSTAITLFDLGKLAEKRGEMTIAGGRFEEGLRLFWQIENLPGVAATLERIGAMTLRSGRLAPAVRLLAAAETLRGDARDDPDPGDREERKRDLAAARSTLGEAEFDAAWAAGRHLSPAQAVADGLSLAQEAAAGGRALPLVTASRATSTSLRPERPGPPPPRRQHDHRRNRHAHRS